MVAVSHQSVFARGRTSFSRRNILLTPKTVPLAPLAPSRLRFRASAMIPSDPVIVQESSRALLRAAASSNLPCLALLPSLEQLDELAFQASQWANDLVVSATSSSLDPQISQSAVLAALVAGLATSLSPCTLSVLPFTVGYIAGSDPGRARSSIATDSLLFVAGLASTRVALGVTAALAGQLYGQAFGEQLGFLLPLFVAFVALLMGFNLLGLVSLRLPSFLGDVDPKDAAEKLPRPLQMYLAGLVFALVASPCATPVLASLLAYVASTKDVAVGGSLLFVYTLGSAAPLLLAASFAGAMRQLLALRPAASWLTPAAGCLLVAGGTYSFLDNLVPADGMMVMMGSMLS